MITTQPPTGVLLGQYAPGTPEWEQARAGLCITATEIAAVVGLSPWQSRFSLWHKKAGLPTPPFQPNPAVEWGNRLEDAVAKKFADEHGMDLHETGTWRHCDRDWQRATPDRIGDNCLVEVKTSPFGEGWGPAGSDEIPVYYRCQVQWQMDVTGYRTTHVALLVSGHDYREYTVEYDIDDARILREAAWRFLDDVRQGNRPPIDGADATYQTIRVQPTGRDDIDVEIPLDLAARYEVIGDQRRTVDTEFIQVRGEVLDLIGNGYRAVCGERRIAYRTVNPDGTTLALQPYRSTHA
ncbi:YqaJ viral recombinase family nuclease [Streptomyces nymphaeiformis]|uniref:Putative phage-type endonuclease n=1 Tax=Streptomyces nymphaeiformis TaxID=2663842 RepID=A0A7W7XE59_9ACTN|nr:YqaJ viral recombinase family protein [Streptomyces nymphaeiformis]MBB4984965.1 putative phage-type endonuclease [Streptomyces nymphaeiformis]